MKDRLNPRFVASFTAISKTGGGFAALLGFFVLVGWSGNISFLKSVRPEWPPMGPITALCFILLGISLILSQAEQEAKHSAARGCALLVIALSLLKSAEYLFGRELVPDMLFFQGSRGAVQMPPNTAIAFILLGTAMLFFEAKLQHIRLARFLSLPATALALLPFLGYLYGLTSLAGIANFTKMAPNSALAFLVLCFAIFFARPAEGFMSIVASDEPGGILMRRLFPSMLGLTLGLGWLVLAGEHAGFYDPHMGTTLLVLSLIAVIAAIVSSSALSFHRMATEQERTEETLLQAEQEKKRIQREQVETLKETDRLKDEFLSVISHELRTPLNAIMGFGSLLDEEIPGSLNAQQSEFIKKILDSSEKMLELIDSLLDFARMQAGKFEINRCEVSYESVVHEVVSLFLPAAQSKKISIATDVEVPGLVSIDGQRIFQVLSNLVSNAIKFTPEGSKITIKARIEGGELITEVEDSGIGIAPEDLKRLFTRFTQLDMGLTRKAGGTGLGLSIAKGIVEAHGGSISASSLGPGKGSTFRFELPLS